MKVKHFSAALILLLAFTACSSITVNTDYDPEADFLSYKTFSFYDGKKTEGNALEANPLVKKRVEAGVAKALEAKGFTKTDGDADVVIILHTGEKDKVRIDTYNYGGYGYGRYRWGYGWGGYSDVDVTQYTETTLFIDIADASKKELVWRGTGTGVVKSYSDQADMQEAIDNVTAKILVNFPPMK